jgi:hypothetical protein
MNSFNECKAIIELDLDPIKVKLMHVESGEGWSRAQADAVEQQYRRFLYLVKTYPNEYAAPRADIDIFWHYHILDTMKYAIDCEEIFGYFLHHFPYVGLRGATDEDVHEDAAHRMSELYEQTFQEPYEAVMTMLDSVATASREAYSLAVPQDAIRLPGATTAFSTRVPRDAIMAAGPKTAFSTRIPMNAFMAPGTRTAFSTRVPLNAVMASGNNAAFSTRVPQQVITASGASAAFSTRVPRDAHMGALSSFSLQRPTLTTT